MKVLGVDRRDPTQKVPGLDTERRAPLERAPERTAGSRHKAPGPEAQMIQKERRSPTQIAGPRHSEGGPGHDAKRQAPTQSAGPRHSEGVPGPGKQRRQRASGSDTKKDRRSPKQNVPKNISYNYLLLIYIYKSSDNFIRYS